VSRLVLEALHVLFHVFLMCFDHGLSIGEPIDNYALELKSLLFRIMLYLGCLTQAGTLG